MIISRNPPNRAIEALKGFVLPAALVPLAGNRPAPTSPEPHRHPWAWAATLCAHAVILALFLFVRREPALTEASSPPSLAVVFDNGGTTQATAPRQSRQGPPSIAQTTPPPPPPQIAPEQSFAPIDVPPVPLPNLTPQAAPPAAPPAAPNPQPHPVQHPARSQRYVVMQGMSYGSLSPVMPSPPQTHRALNFDLPQSDAQAVTGQEVTIKGDIGADWQAALDKWVEAHKYYPQAAAEQNQQGNVEIEFTVDRQGNVTGLHMLRGSGSPFLDQAWFGLFKDAELPPFPTNTKSDHVTVDATMHFIIEGQ